MKIFFHFYNIIIIVLNFGLAFWVLSKNIKSKVNTSFAFFVSSAALWAMTLYLFYIVDIPNIVLLLGRINFVAVIWLASLLYLFVYYFPRKIFTVSKSTLILFIIETIVLTILTLFTNLIDKNELILGGERTTVYGQLYLLFILHFLFYIISSIFVLYKKYKVFRGFEKLQLKYLIWGFVLSMSFGFITNILIPLIWNFYQVQIYGILATLIAISFISYAILKYRLMDLRVIIRRSAVFTVLVLVITALYAVLSYLLSVFFTDLIGVQSVILNGIVMAILVALGFEPLKRFLSEITDSFLFKAEYKPQEVLSEFSDKLASTLDLNVLSQFMVARLNAVLKTTFASLFLLAEEKKEYIKVAESGKIIEKVNYIDKNLFAKVYNYLKEINKAKDILVREEIKKINEQSKSPVLGLLIREFEKYEVNLMVPFYLQEKLIGILFLGDKKSGDVYSQEDLRVLEIIASQSAVSINNAQLFEEQKHFAEHLKKEVEKATKELKIANIQLRKLDKAKSEFISIASHQLRTPLTVIRGYISMIEQGDFGIVSLKVKEPLDRVYKSTMRIIGLVEDLLNISRIESGRLKYDFKLTDLTSLVFDVYEELKQQAKNKGLQFDFAKPEKEIPQIMLDQGKIREVIMNLTDNAIKYTDSGFVRVKLARDNDHVTFSVSDSGRGLDTDEIPLLFQKFSRAKGAQLMHTEGTGLGLYIAKNIIAKHGGKIWVESPGLNKGSSFYIRFKINNKRLEKEVGKK